MLIFNSEVSVVSLLNQSVLSTQELYELNEKLVELLIKVHKQQLVGRLHPQNIKLTQDQLYIYNGALTDEQLSLYRAPELFHIKNDITVQSDLYSLGVIMYNMYTGEYPIVPTAIQNWGEAHLFNEVKPITQIDAKLNSIILKLLDKNPSQRYQSALGLLADIRLLITNNLQSESWTVGEMDSKLLIDNHFNIALPLHINQWLESYINKKSQHDSEVVAIIGEQRSGKTTILNKVAMRFEQSDYYVVKVTCRQAEGGQYAILKSIISCYLEHFASYSPVKLKEIVEKITNHHILQTSYLAVLFPRFKAFLEFTDKATHLFQILNISNDVYEKSFELKQLIELCNLFHEEISKSIVWCIDNVDCVVNNDEIEVLSASLNSFKKTVLVVVTHTKNAKEIDSEQASFIYQLPIQNLTFDEALSIFNSILGRDSSKARLLTQGALYRSKGNIGLLYELVQQWIYEQQIYFDRQRLCWVCKDDLIVNQNFEEDVHRFMVQKLDGLESEIQKVIAIAALIGKRVNPLILADIFENNTNIVYETMKQAESIGFIYHDQQTEESVLQVSEYVFLYDELRSHFSSLIEHEKAEWHYKIALILYNKYRDIIPNSTKKYMYHFNESHVYLSQEGLISLIDRNTELGFKYFEEQQFTDARYFFQSGCELCIYYGDEFNKQLYTFQLYLATTLHVLGETKLAVETFNKLEPFKDQLGLNELRMYYIWQMEISALDNHERSYELGIQALKLYGWEMPQKVTTGQLVKEVILAQRILKKFTEGNIRTKTKVSEEIKLFYRIAYSISHPLVMINPELLMYFFARFIRKTIREGMTEDFALVISIYEIALQRGAPDLFKLFPTDAFTYIKEKEKYESQHLYMIQAIQSQVYRPDEVYTFLMITIKKAIEMKDYRSVNLSILMVIIFFNEDIDTLDSLLELIYREVSTIIDANMLPLVEELKLFYEVNRDKNKLLNYIAPNLTIEEQHINFMSMNRAEMALLSKHYELTLFWTNLGEQSIIDVNWIQNRKIFIFKHLAFSGLYFTISDEKIKKYYKISVKKIINKMKKWEGLFGFESSYYYLFLAEYSFMDNNKHLAQSYYEKAINVVRKEKNAKIEGLILERLSFFYSKQGSETGTLIALMDALSAYSAFGLHSKVSLLNEQIKETGQSRLEADSMPVQPLIINESGETEQTNPSRFMNSDHHLQQIYELKGHWNDHQFIQSFLNLACRQVVADYGVLYHYDTKHFKVVAQYGQFVNADNSNDYQPILNYCVNTMSAYHFNASAHNLLNSHMTNFSIQSLLAIPIRLPHRSETYILLVTSQHFQHVFQNQEELVLELLLSRFIYLAEQNQVSSKQVTSYLQTSVQTAVLTTLLDPLTERELEVLREIVKGLSNYEITVSLDIKLATVKTHINNVYSKLGVKRRAQAILKAKEMNLV